MDGYVGQVQVKLKMSSNAFQRSPSKVWWAQGLDEHSHTEWHNRNGTGSPSSHKSQDSGFSDSEISPALVATAKPDTDTIDDKHEKTFNAASKRLHVTEQLSANIRKDFTLADSSTPKKNFTENNIKEKYSPKKSVTKYLTESLRKKEKDDPTTYNCRSLPTTPVDNTRNYMLCLSKSTSQAPSPLPSPLLHQCRRLTLYNSPNASLDETKVHHHSTKVSRNLFKYFPTDNNQDNVAITSSTTTNTEYNHYEEQHGSDYESIANNTENINLEQRHYNLHSITQPTITQPTMKSKLNITVPLYYQYHLDKIETDFDDNYNNNNNYSSDHSIQNSDSDVSLNGSSNDVISCESFSYQNEEICDCEKEVEALFPELFENIDSPTHTSTPKQNLFQKCSASSMRKRIMKQKGKSASSYEMIECCTETNPAVQLQQIPSVKCWLTEVEKLYEPECMTTLQCKSIAYDLAKHVARLADNTTTPIRDLLRHSKIILKEFNNIKMKVKLNEMEHLAPLTQSLVGNVTEFVLKNMINSQSSSLVDVKMTKLEIENLLDLCGKLRKSTIQWQWRPSIDDISQLLINLQETFYTTENNILAMQIQLLVNAIEDSSTHLALRGVLSGLTSLATQCERLSNLIVETGGPRALLILCVESKASTIRTMALRTLATVCCSTAAIRQLEQAEGIEVLADILSDTNRPEPELSEATAVLAQITAPWIEDNHSVQGLAENADALITAITAFLEKSKCCQNVLLCAAALANITYMNVNAVGSLIRNQTVRKLLSAVRNRGPKASVFLKEQTATFIANISDVPDSRKYLSDNNAGVALLCFLQIYPMHSQDTEIQCNAARRLQQKSAIALSRLCSDGNVAQQIVELGGVTRLVQLCKEGKERNNSDAVLVACLATLRKIVANCGDEVMDQRDIMELVEPRLLDSFLAYSSQNESYV